MPVRVYLCRRCRFLSLVEVLPSFILDTGVTAIHADHADCINLEAPATDNNTMNNAKSSVPIDLKCWAYVAGAPNGPVPDVNPVTDEVELSLEQGLKIAGKVNLFNFVKFDMIAVVDFLSLEPEKRFMIDVEVQPILVPSAENPLIQIGKTIDANGEATGGAQFFVDASFGGVPGTQTLAVDIQAAIAFPFIRSYGMLKMQITDEGVYFKAHLDLFQGVITSGVEAKWKWDMSSFYMRMYKITFGAVKVHDLEISFEMNAATAAFKYMFKADITVLMLLKIQGEFNVATRDDNPRQVQLSPSLRVS